MPNPAIDVALLSYFLPPIFAIIIQAHWERWQKQIASFLLYMLVATFVFIYRNHIDTAGWQWRDYVDCVWPVFMGGVLGYRTLWSDTVKDAIEVTTTPGATTPGSRVP